MSISRRSFVSSVLTACAGAAAVVRMTKPATVGLDMAASGTRDVTAVTVGKLTAEQRETLRESMAARSAEIGVEVTA